MTPGRTLLGKNLSGSRHPAPLAPDGRPPRGPVLVVRPRRVRQAAWVAAVAVVATFAVVASVLRTTDTGVFFRTADQVAMVLLGVLIAGGHPAAGPPAGAGRRRRRGDPQRRLAALPALGAGAGRLVPRRRLVGTAGPARLQQELNRRQPAPPRIAGGRRIGGISRHLKSGITADDIVHGSKFLKPADNPSPGKCLVSERPALAVGMLCQIASCGSACHPRPAPRRKTTNIATTQMETSNDSVGMGMTSCDGGSMPARPRPGFDLSQFWSRLRRNFHAAAMAAARVGSSRRTPPATMIEHLLALESRQRPAHGFDRQSQIIRDILPAHGQCDGLPVVADMGQSLSPADEEGRDLLFRRAPAQQQHLLLGQHQFAGRKLVDADQKMRALFNELAERFPGEAAHRHRNRSHPPKSCSDRMAPCRENRRAAQSR